jgi:hypothetical protein
MILEIPLNSNDPIFRITVPLDGGTYVLDFDWSARSEAWFLDMYVQSDTDPQPILLGQKCTVNYPWLRGVVVDGRPVGEIALFDLNASGECGRYDLGTRCRLVYADADELGRV